MMNVNGPNMEDFDATRYSRSVTGIVTQGDSGEVHFQSINCMRVPKVKMGV
jgi:hypothetical protein